MRIVGLDTATEARSAALWADGALAARRFVRDGGRHAEALMPMVAALAREGGVPLAETDLFAVTVGPGSFTGIRIGLAAARGLALAAGKPLIGLTTLEVLAAGVPGGERTGPVLATLDAGRGRLYAQLFDPALHPLCAPRAVPAGGLGGLLEGEGGLQDGPLVLAGTGQEQAADALPPAFEPHRALASVWPDAGVLVRCAAEGADRAMEGATIRPLYLREFGARDSHTTLA